MCEAYNCCPIVCNEHCHMTKSHTLANSLQSQTSLNPRPHKVVSCTRLVHVAKETILPVLLDNVLQFLIEVKKFLERRLVCLVTEKLVEVWDKL